MQFKNELSRLASKVDELMEMKHDVARLSYMVEVLDATVMTFRAIVSGVSFVL